jgi:hypothetical protein
LGLWKGKYSNSTTTQPTQDLYLLLLKDGTAKIYNGSDTATALKSEYGKWSLDQGYLIKVSYWFSANTPIYSLKFVCDENYTKSISPNMADIWGTGYLLVNIPITQIGWITFTKP